MFLDNLLLNITNELSRLVAEGANLQKVALPSSLSSLFVYQISKPNDGGLIVAGLGADFNQKLAYTKCLVEYIERKAFYDFGLSVGFNSTNGIAGHYFNFMAKRNAYAELLERDSFLLHWYSKIPFISVNCSNKIIIKFQEQSPEYEIKFYKTFLGEITTYICFIILRSTGGFVIGLSSGKNTLGDELNKAFSEAVINLYFGSGGTESQTYDGHSLNSLSDHRNYWLQRNLPPWICESVEKQNYEYVRLPHNCLASFNVKYDKIWVYGSIVTNLLRIKLGLPDEHDLLLLKTRIRTTKSFFPMGNEPHPIP